VLKDLADHLAHHASVGFAECRGMEAPKDPPIPSMVREELATFVVTHEGVAYRVTVAKD
jgi:hypothetical protein